MSTNRSEAAKKAWISRRARKASIDNLKNILEKRRKNKAAAKKAWETRRKDEENAEAERQEALRILEEMAKSIKD